MRLGVVGNALGYLRRRATARVMLATMSWPMPTSRVARAMCDGLLGPSHTGSIVRKLKITCELKSTLLRIGLRAGGPSNSNLGWPIRDGFLVTGGERQK